MINLLPDETKKQLRAARINVTLARYLIFLAFASGFLVLACGTSYLFLMNSRPSNTKPVSSTNQTETAAYDAAKAQYSTFTTSFSTAKTILDQQVSYSDIITSIGASLPTGVIIENLIIDGTKINSPITIQVKAKSADDAPKMKENFEKSTMFKSFSIQSVTTTQNDPSGYSVAISISLTINKGLSL